MYLDREEVKGFCNYKGVDLDAKFDLYIQWAEQYIREFLLHDPEVKSRVETYDGNGADVMFLNEFPVQEVTKVEYLDTDNKTWKELQADRILSYDEGFVKVFGVKFPKGYKNVRFTYTAGYSPMHPMIKLAGMELCFLKHKDSPSGDGRLGVTSKVKGTTGAQFQENLDKAAYSRVLNPIARFRKLRV